MGVTTRRHCEGLWCSEMGMYECSSPSLCWLYQRILLKSNASKEELGAVLFQKQADGQYLPVTYGSQALMAHKKNYHSTKLEFLALKWAVTEHFKEYLPYQPFLVSTDNNPLTYIMTTHNLNTTGYQRVGALARLNFQLEYQKGWDNTVADMLSWITTPLSPEAMSPILDRVALGATHRAEGYDPAMVKCDSGIEKEVHVAAGWALVEMHVTDWAKTQTEDLVLDAVLNWLEAQEKTDLKTLLWGHASSKRGQLVGRNCQNFMIHQKALYLHSMPKDENEDLLLFIVPRAHRVTTLNGCHRDAGHQGHDHTLYLLQECFWWPGMTSQLQQSIRNCTCCLQHEGGLPKAPLHPVMATAPLDLLHVNSTSIATTMEPTQSPRSITSWYSKTTSRSTCWHVTPDQTAKTIAKFLYQGYISIFGAPVRLLTDRGAHFMSSMIDEMCKILGVKKLQTMPYHPQTNGLVERSHQTIMWMIRKLGEDKKADWPSHLTEMACGTGYSPHYLMFRWRPRHLVDFYFPTIGSTEAPMREASTKHVDEYIASVWDRLRTTLWGAQTQSMAEACQQKWYYDQKIGIVNLKPGNLVLVKADAFKGERKIKDRWEEDMWKVVHQIMTDIPSYEVIDQCRRSCILHRNWLLLITSQAGIPLCIGIFHAQDRCTSPTPWKPTTTGGKLG